MQSFYHEGHPHEAPRRQAGKGADEIADEKFGLAYI